MHFLVKAAEAGLAEAQFAIGAAHATGQGVERDYLLALHWYQSAAQQGLASAQYALANLYANGQGVSVDLDEALVWYRKAAGQNFAAAQVAMEFIDASGHGRSKGRTRGRRKPGVIERRRESVEWARVAELGDADAKYHLGLMYELGLRVPQDDTQAQDWYLAAARQGDVRAQLALAKIYENHQNTDDLAWYRAAAEQGNSDAQFALGRKYSSSQHAEQDFFLGVSWYLKAGAGGHARALLTLGHIFGAGVEHLSVACLTRAAELGEC
jgi:TPR repeat protein